MNHQIKALEVVSSITTISIGNSKNMRAFVDNEGGIWFCLRDVLSAMASSTRTNQVIPTISDIFEDGCVQVIPIQDALGRTQNVAFAHESATTYLIANGNTETSKNLNRKIHAEILPELRKTGRYELKPLTIEERFAIALRDANKLLDERDARIEQEKLAHQKTGMKLLHTEQIVKAQKPKAEFFDNFARSESNKSLRDAFYALGIKNTNKMTNFLRHGVVDYKKENSCRWLALTSPPKPIQYSLDNGFLVVKQIEDATGKVRNQTLVTPKGFIELARLKKVGLIPAEFFVSED